MDSNIKRVYVISYSCGLILIFISFFLEWYVFQAYDTERELVASWSYNIFLGWLPHISQESVIHDALRPEDFSIPLILNLFYIIMILISGYSIIGKAVKDSHIFTYIYLCLLIMVIFYIIIFPIVFLIPNHLYFPYSDYEDTFSHFYCNQSIGLGYILQLISLIFIFPHTYFSLMTIFRFEKEQRTTMEPLIMLLKETQEPVDLDTLIAEEQSQLTRKR